MNTITEPAPRAYAGAALEPAARAGRGELGMVSIAEQVVTKIAARAAAENPDAGRRWLACSAVPFPVPGIWVCAALT